MNEIKVETQTLREKNAFNERLIFDLKAENQKLALDKDKFKDDKTRLEIILNEKERNKGAIDEQLNLLKV